MVRLDIMQGVQHNHAGRDRYLVLDQLAPISIAAKYFELCLRHKRTKQIFTTGDTENTEQNSMHESSDTILQHNDVEVHKKSDLNSGQFKIRQ